MPPNRGYNFTKRRLGRYIPPWKLQALSRGSTQLRYVLRQPPEEVVDAMPTVEFDRSKNRDVTRWFWHYMALVPSAYDANGKPIMHRDQLVPHPECNSFQLPCEDGDTVIVQEPWECIATGRVTPYIAIRYLTDGEIRRFFDREFRISIHSNKRQRPTSMQEWMVRRELRNVQVSLQRFDSITEEEAEAELKAQLGTASGQKLSYLESYRLMLLQSIRKSFSEYGGGYYYPMARSERHYGDAEAILAGNPWMCVLKFDNVTIDAGLPIHTSVGSDATLAEQYFQSKKGERHGS